MKGNKDALPEQVGGVPPVGGWRGSLRKYFPEFYTSFASRYFVAGFGKISSRRPGYIDGDSDRVSLVRRGVLDSEMNRCFKF